MVIPFFLINSVPVFAEVDYNYNEIPYWQLMAYQYWSDYGYTFTFNYSFDQVNRNSYSGSISAGTETISITQGSFSGTTGTTGRALICQPQVTGTANNSMYYCQYHGNTSVGSTNYGTSQNININAVALNGSITDPKRSISITSTENETFWNYFGHQMLWASGKYIHSTEFNSSHYFNIKGDSHIYFIFLSKKNLWYVGSKYRFIELYPDVSTYAEYDFDWVANEYGSASNGIYMYKFDISLADGYKTNSNHFFSFDIVNLIDSDIYPIYVGNGLGLPSDVAESFGIPTTTDKLLAAGNDLKAKNNTLVESGNNISQSAENALSGQNEALSGSVNQINSIETTYNDDLNAALNDIDISTDLVQHTGFTNAALWVATQFNRFVIGTPIELVLTFSLVTGLGLILLGRVRG